MAHTHQPVKVFLNTACFIDAKERTTIATNNIFPNETFSPLIVSVTVRISDVSYHYSSWFKVKGHTCLSWIASHLMTLCRNTLANRPQMFSWPIVSTFSRLTFSESRCATDLHGCCVREKRRSQNNSSYSAATLHYSIITPSSTGTLLRQTNQNSWLLPLHAHTNTHVCDICGNIVQRKK